MVWDIEAVRAVWDLAARAHQGQQYAGPAPGESFEYLKHIGSVTMEVMQALIHHPEADARLALCCAILHDTVEDTDVTPELIRRQFGPEVAAGVAALTKNTTLEGKAAQMADSLRRIKSQAREVWMVKMADRITNLSPPPFYWTNEKTAAYHREAQLIYDQLHPASEPLARRLLEKIEAYQSFFGQG